jgi:transcription antitermination factor NusG
MQPHTYAVGDRVRVIDGPLANFEAQVREVLSDRLKLDVAVRQMSVPIETEFGQVVRLD